MQCQQEETIAAAKLPASETIREDVGGGVGVKANAFATPKRIRPAGIDDGLSLACQLPRPSVYFVPGLGEVVSLSTYETAVSRAQDLFDKVLEKMNQRVEDVNEVAWSVFRQDERADGNVGNDSPSTITDKQKQRKETTDDLPSVEPTKKKQCRRPPPKTAEGMFKRAQTLQARWEGQFEELRAFKAQHGHCNVNKSHQYPKLLRWVGAQRTQHKCLREGKPSKLTPERIQKLLQLGFAFSLGPDRIEWYERLEQLKAYKEKHGTCNVSQKDQKGVPTGLGNWVLEQRRRYKSLMRKGSSKKGLTAFNQDRIDALEAIGFEWQVRKYKS